MKPPKRLLFVLICVSFTILFVIFFIQTEIISMQYNKTYLLHKKGKLTGTLETYNDVYKNEFKRTQDFKAQVFHSNVPQNENTIAICTLARSKPRWTVFKDSDLYRFFLKSTYKTTQPPVEGFDVMIHVGINTDDYFFVDRIEEGMRLVGTEFGMNITFHKFDVAEQDSIPMNSLMQSAANTGAQYLVRLNDDTEIMTKRWITRSVNQLQSFSPPNIGVVGPTCREGNTAILTHDMVHRKHIDIFGSYYPKILKNWYIDDWISSVYGPKRTSKLKDWLVIHHVEGGTRYKPAKSQFKLLKPLIEEGKQKINNFLNTKNEINLISYSLYGKNPRYTDGAIENAKLYKKIYPGWRMRVYYDKTVPPQVLDTLQKNNVELYDMTFSKINKMSWRFIASNNVTRLCSRDIDSRLSKREKYAVDAWIMSNKTFHIMRDHPSHSKHAISGGMWCTTTAGIQEIENLKMSIPMSNLYFKDMDWLNTNLWPIAKKDVLQHDSFSAEKFGGGLPFPTERVAWEHVGSVYVDGKMRNIDVSLLQKASESHLVFAGARVHYFITDKNRTSNCYLYNLQESKLQRSVFNAFKRIYNVLAKFTKNQDIQYWIEGGTLLHSLRFGENWDDVDVDFGLILRKHGVLFNILDELQKTGMIFKNEITRKPTDSVQEIYDTMHPSKNLIITGRYQDSQTGYPWDTNIHIYILENGGLRTRGGGRWLHHSINPSKTFLLTECAYFGEAVPCPVHALEFLENYDNHEYGNREIFAIPKRDKRTNSIVTKSTILHMNERMNFLEKCKFQTFKSLDEKLWKQVLARFDAVPDFTDNYKYDPITNAKYDNICDVAYKTRSRDDLKFPLESNSIICTRGTSDILHSFFNLGINVPFTLLTIESDESITKNEKWLNYPYLKRWYSWNSIHPAIVPIPIGLNHDTQLLPMKKCNHHTQKIKELLVSFKLDRQDRRDIYMLFKDLPFARVIKYEKLWENSNHLMEYYEEVSRYQWVLCPRGEGLDTHRIWETLYLGSTPVVLRGPLHRLYSQFPIIQVDTWENINISTLKNMQNRFNANQTLLKLNFSFWEHLIRTSNNYSRME